MIKTCEISEDGKSVGTRKVEISSRGIVIYSDPIKSINIEQVADYADSMASANDKTDDFEGLQFRIDINESSRIKRRLLLTYVTEVDPELDDYEEEFARFIAPLRKYFMKALFGKSISELTESDLNALYGDFEPSIGNKYAMIIMGAFFSGTLFFILLIIMYNNIYGNTAEIFKSWSHIITWMILTALATLVFYNYFLGRYGIRSDGFRFDSELRHVSIPWSSVTKLTKTEKRTGKSQYIIKYVYTLFYTKDGKSRKFKFDGLELRANDFQRILRVTRAKLKGIPQLRSRGWNNWTGKVKDYVPW